MPILELENVHISYGQVPIIFGISLSVEAGEIVCILGRNGVGKTTTLQGIMGINRPQGGGIRFNGKDVSGRRPFEIARAGIGYIPEDRRIFRDLSVLENLKIGGLKTSGLRRIWDLEKVYELFPNLKARLSQRGSRLSGGEQQMLAIARALMGNPVFLLMDEPTQGLAPIMQQRLSALIRNLKNEGITILLAEQSLNLALEVSDRVYIMEKGFIKFEGSIREINEDKSIIKKYLLV